MLPCMSADRFWIAHRGGGNAAPENTLAAIRAGRAAGFRAFECDVQLSRDGVAFLLHDAQLQRTTDGRGRAAAQPWAALARLQAGPDEALPRLDAVLAYAARHRLWLNIELKPAPGEARRVGSGVAREVAAALQRWPRLPCPLLSSFAPLALRAARAQAQALHVSLPLALLAEHWRTDLPLRARRLHAVALHLHWRALSPARVRAAHAAGLAVRAYTVNRADCARRLRRIGVDGVFTDRLDLPRR